MVIEGLKVIAAAVDQLLHSFGRSLYQESLNENPFTSLSLIVRQGFTRDFREKLHFDLLREILLL